MGASDEMDGERLRDAPILILVGERVALGPMHRGMIPLAYRWINDLAVTRTMGLLPRPSTIEQEETWYESMTSDPGTVHFAIYERSTNRPIGSSNLHQLDFHHRTAGFGIMIGEAECRGKGYGTEAARLTLDFAFTALGLHNVMLTTFEFNRAGRHAYEKAGFREIGRRREARWRAGRFWDEILMDCLASDFTSPVLARMLTPDVEPRSLPDDREELLHSTEHD